MRNQYSLRPAGSSDPPPPAADSSQQQVVGLKSKLHNLVAGRLAPTGSHQQPSSSPNQRPARILSPQQSSAAPMHPKRQPPPAGAPTSRAEFSARRLVRRQLLPASSGPLPLVAPGGSSTSSALSERISPELARCYDEIDQIYDYIRGLAPLPVQLRKIKSIDFELIERERRLARHQQQAAQIHRSRLQQLKPASSRQAAETGAQSADRPRPRQRDASPPLIDAEPDQLERRSAAPATKTVHGPLPIKVVTSALSHQYRPSVKRVESFTISEAPGERDNRRPAYLMSSPQRGQLFRLPRAHSTSTLNKPDERHRQPQEPTLELSGTLPAKTRVFEGSDAHRDPSGSLGRLRARLLKLERPAARTEIVESFLDEERDSEAHSSSSASEGAHRRSGRTSGNRQPQSSSSESATSSDNEASDSEQSAKPTRVVAEPKSSSSSAEKSHSDYENDSASISGSSSSSDLTSSLDELVPGANPKNKSANCNEGSHEHIYEQIPAHKQLEASNSAGRAPKLYTKHPVAYAPNIAAAQRHRAQPVAKVPSRAAPHPLYPFGSTPRPVSQHPAALAGYLSARPLDYRYRLSMGNLHMIPHLSPAAPFNSIPHYPYNHLLEAQQQLNRASSSSKVNRVQRAPRLSPAQLIAKIQVPRAVNKRQQQPQAPANANRSPPQQSWFAWPSLVQQPKTRPSAEASKPANPFASRHRGSARRLTAIGIEDVTAFARTQNPQQQVASIKYFEPPQLVGAPLIDEDTELIDDQRHQTTGGESSSDREQEQQTSKVFRKTKQDRHLNSISDFHSFSSTEDGEESTSGTKSQELAESAAGPQRADAESDFVSSRSFIKCYYGKEPDSKAAKAETTRAKPTGRKLLGLIGLNRSSSGESSGAKLKHKADDKREDSSQRPVSRQPRRHLKSPTVGELFVSATSAKSRPSATKLVGEFLGAEGPILVRDRRIAALKSDLVRHYEHPTVRVAKVPSYQPQQQSIASSAAPSSPAGTNTTDSTSSYEAAMKNGRTLDADADRPVEAKPASVAPKKAKATTGTSNQSSGPQATGGSALIRVPKLSKQSHLLNRPLPRLPTADPSRRQLASASHHSSAHRTPQTTDQRLVPTSQQQAKYRRPPAKTLVSTNLDSPSAISTSAKRQTSASTTQSKGPTRQLMPLTVSLVTQPSPTVTTYTSSGISSRLTSATHLASNASSGGSSGRSRSLGGSRRRTSATQATGGELAGDASSFKSLPTAATGAPANGLATSASPLGFKSFERQSDDFELMDDDAGRLDAAETPAPSDNKENVARRDEQRQVPMSSNLKLFDERFSSKFTDTRLASSDDSLLESLDFGGGGGGTLSRKSQPSERLKLVAARR